MRLFRRVKSRNTRGGKPSNSNPVLFWHCKFGLTNGFVRKLEEILCELKPLVDQGKVAGFFLNVKNSEKLGGLAEDIRDAMMEYQVCISLQFISTTSEACTRPHYSRISTTRVACSLWVSSMPLIFMD